MSVIIGSNNRDKNDEKITQQVENIDEAWASLAKDKRWEIVAEYMLDRIAYYEEALNGAIDSGVDFKIIGEKYSVHAKVKSEFVALINRVEEAAREIERQRNNLSD